MGSCMSSPGGLEVSEMDKALHREAEKQLREVRASLSYTNGRKACAGLINIIDYRPKPKWLHKSR